MVKKIQSGELIMEIKSIKIAEGIISKTREEKILISPDMARLCGGDYSAAALLALLLRWAGRTTWRGMTDEVILSVKQACGQLGITSEKTIRRAKEILINHGIVSCSTTRYGRGSITVWKLDLDVISNNLGIDLSLELEENLPDEPTDEYEKLVYDYLRSSEINPKQYANQLKKMGLEIEHIAQAIDYRDKNNLPRTGRGLVSSTAIQKQHLEQIKSASEIEIKLHGLTFEPISKIQNAISDRSLAPEFVTAAIIFRETKGYPLTLKGILESAVIQKNLSESPFSVENEAGYLESTKQEKKTRKNRRVASMSF